MKGKTMSLWRNGLKEVTTNSAHGGIQIKYYFKNGYAASIVMHNWSYGGDEGLFELALMNHNDDLIYKEDFGDVLGYLDFGQVNTMLTMISFFKPLDS
jgi:hypothetical protein